MRRKPRIIHIAWVRGSCCLRGKPRRKGGRLIEFLMDGVVILFGFIFCLGGVVALLIVEDHLRRRFSYFDADRSPSGSARACSFRLAARALISFSCCTAVACKSSAVA